MITPTTGDEGRPVLSWSREYDGWNCEEGTLVRWIGETAMVQYPVGYPMKARMKNLQWGDQA